VRRSYRCGKAKNGRPDVVFMIYRGGDRDTIEQRKGSFKPYDASEEPYFTDDDAAKAANRCTGVDQRTRSQLPQLDRARAQRRPRREFHQALADPPRRPADWRTTSATSSCLRANAGATAVAHFDPNQVRDDHRRVRALYRR
jgi:hypothetical protein